MHERLLTRFRPPASTRPRLRGAATGVRVRWLGTAGHVLEGARTTLLIDPFVSRPSPLRVLLAPLESDPAAIARHVPSRVDGVLVGHSHFDHLLDAPAIALRAGAKLVGSRTTSAFGRAAGLTEAQLVEVPPEGATAEIGDARVTFVPSLHARLALGRVPFAGEVASPPRLPARAHRYRMGGAFGLLVELDGVRIYHNGSADLVDAEVAGLRADVALVGLAGRRATARYLPRLLGALTPSVVVPTHHDSFFAPLEAGARLLPGVDFGGFLSDVAELAPGARVLAPGYDDVMVVGAGAARDAALWDR
ncbi:MAG: MBL fold metallo-hydrolase [Polyangiaceae bacterium]|nr:MBL fold metallo-hydrolase [Polyangiaceae bacterium]